MRAGCRNWYLDALATNGARAVRCLCARVMTQGALTCLHGHTRMAVDTMAGDTNRRVD